MYEWQCLFNIIEGNIARSCVLLKTAMWKKFSSILLEVTQMSTSDLSRGSDANKTTLIQATELGSSTQPVDLNAQTCPVYKNEGEGCHPKGCYVSFVC